MRDQTVLVYGPGDGKQDRVFIGHGVLECGIVTVDIDDRQVLDSLVSAFAHQLSQSCESAPAHLKAE